MEEKNKKLFYDIEKQFSIIGAGIPFTLKLGNDEYEGRAWCSVMFYFYLMQLELIGLPAYNFMKRNKIQLDDIDDKLWDFIENHFERLKGE